MITAIELRHTALIFVLLGAAFNPSLEAAALDSAGRDV